jgi:hypothetical protein
MRFKSVSTSAFVNIFLIYLYFRILNKNDSQVINMITLLLNVYFFNLSLFKINVAHGGDKA